MGRNGVGKTTTLKSIVGLAKTDSGTVQLGDVLLSGFNPNTGPAADWVTFPKAETFFRR